MEITGNFAIDLGYVAKKFIETEFSMNENEAILFVIDRYLTEWKKLTYTFYPNSPFNNPSLKPEKAKRLLIETYIENSSNQLSKRDKIILSGSSSFVNFYPHFQIPKATKSELLGNLFLPLSGCFFKGMPYPSFIYSNNLDRIKGILHENIRYNIENSSFLKRDFAIFDYLSEDLLRQKDKGLCYNVYSLSNYNQNPDIQLHYFDSEVFREHFLKRFNENNKTQKKGMDFIGNKKEYVKFIFGNE